MLPIDIICPRCGWRNETGARMCGGCGRSLVVGRPSATSGTPTPSGPATPPAAAEDAPTVVGLPPPAPPPAHPQPADTAAATVPWPGPAAAKGRTAGAARTPAPPRSRRLGRAALVASVVLAVLIVGFLGAWALVIRPAIHSALDQQIRSALNSGVQQAVTQVSRLPPGSIPPTDLTIPASDFDQAIAASLPHGIPVSDVAVHFAGGQARITYTSWGGPGAVTTTLALANGRPVATGTSVDCPLCLVESGDEMQAAVNDALAQLPTTLQVTSIRAEGDNLIIRVQSAQQ